MYIISIKLENFPNKRPWKTRAPLQSILKATKQINCDDPLVIATTNEIIEQCTTEKEKAIAIHNWVRDSIKFGWTKNFCNDTAANVIKAGCGYCHTKGILFVTLLRCARIPARLHYIELNKTILNGFFSSGKLPGTHVDHVFSEVQIDGKWIKLDSYIIDTKLFEHAKMLLKESQREWCFGIHKYSTVTWDGSSDAFSQCVPDASQGFVKKDFGIYYDSITFYNQCKEANNKPGFLLKLFGGLVFGSGTANGEAIRTGDYRQARKVYEGK